MHKSLEGVHDGVSEDEATCGVHDEGVGVEVLLTGSSNYCERPHRKTTEPLDFGRNGEECESAVR